MSESQNENPPTKEGEHKTPTKRTPSKRMSIIERAQRESEELIKNMGGSLDVEGGRRTRSSARGASAPVTPSTPPPTKKARLASTIPRRGRQKKIDLLEVNNEKKILEQDESPKKSDSATVDDVTGKKKDKNCTENDVVGDGKPEEKEKNSEPIEVDEEEDESEAMEREITEEDFVLLPEIDEAEDEVVKPKIQPPEAPAEPLTTILLVPEGEIPDEEEKPELVPEKEDIKPEEPMEVDESALAADDEKNKPTTDSKDNSPPADSAPIDNNDGANKTEAVHENSIDTAKPEENKVGDSKTVTEASEPKISSPTSTGDVVAAQACN